MSAYDFVAKELVTGRDVPLSEFKGKVSLVVNVASRARTRARPRARETRAPRLTSNVS